MKHEILVGAHTSASGGLENALFEGRDIGATTVQIFTANQRRWVSKPLTHQAIDLWKLAKKETGIDIVMSHDSYLINLGAVDPEILEKSQNAFKEEIARCHQLDLTFLNFHPGAATEGTREECLKRICESLLGMEDVINAGKTRLLLEATAGQGSVVGSRFDELAFIIEKVKDRIPIGVCIDTCHIFAAGYDIRTPEAWDTTLKEFDKVVGLKYLYALHLNDSQKGLGLRVDRHASIGEGMIGTESFKFIMTDPRTKHLPMYLETPRELEKWKKEIHMLRAFAEGDK